MDAAIVGLVVLTYAVGFNVDSFGREVGFNVGSCAGRVVGFNDGRFVGRRVVGFNDGRLDAIEELEVGIIVVGFDVKEEVGFNVELLKYVPLQLGQYANSACPRKSTFPFPLTWSIPNDTEASRSLMTANCMSIGSKLMSALNGPLAGEDTLI